MIINVSGSNGSGKSTIVKTAMSWFDRAEPLMVPNRKRPCAYTCVRKGGRKLFVLGHYETSCGGCDTLAGLFPEKMLTNIYSWIRSAYSEEVDILYEGLIVESDVRRVVELKEDGFPVVVLSIDISLEKCIEAVVERRHERGNFAEFNPKNVISKYRHCMRRRQRFIDAGVRTEVLTREKCIEFIQNALGFHGLDRVPVIEKAEKVTRVRPTPTISLTAFLEGE